MQTADDLDFGRFRLRPRQRLLLVDGVPAELGTRAVEVLLTLIEANGLPVSKDLIMRRVWPEAIVEENNLAVQVHALRAALGADRDLIRTIPRMGYCFTGQVTALDDAAQGDGATPAKAPRQFPDHNLPAAFEELIGREAEQRELVKLLTECRLLTLAGPGGIGKTRLALDVARRVLPQFPDGVWFVDLAPLAGPELVSAAIAIALGLHLGAAIRSTGQITAALVGKRLLLVLDNCEHVITAAAEIAEALQQGATGVKLLATSREPLRADGEFVYRVPSLAVAEASLTNAEEILHYGAVRLFVERARSADTRILLEARHVVAIGAICRRLDGIPLAIELAAAGAAAFGVEELANRLDDRFAALTNGRRTAMPRHQTLRATLDWSYNLLTATEQTILRRLAAFHGEFTMDAAGAVVADGILKPNDVVSGLASLVYKSLVVADMGADITYYHLLEMTRTYALEKLQASGEHARLMRMHAEFYRAIFAGAENGASARSKGQWYADYGRMIGNLRGALHWAFSPDGDASIGVSLAAVATDFWVAMSLLTECCDWGLKAVAQLGAFEGTRAEMMLQCGLGQALTYSRGMQCDARVALTRTLELAEALADDIYQFRAIYGLWLFALRVVDFRQCMTLANRCEILGETTGDQTAIATADFVSGQTRYYLAEHAAAARSLKRARAAYPLDVRSGDPIRYGADLLTCSRAYQAVTFWSLGFAEQALQAGRDAVSEARTVTHPVSLCVALAMTSSVPLLKMGYFEDAERSIEELIDHSARHLLQPYHALGLCAKGSLAVARGAIPEAERMLRLGLQQFRDVAYFLFHAFFQGELSVVMAASGRLDEAIAEIDSALRYAKESESFWCLAELFRLKGELLAQRASAPVSDAEEWFARSLDLSARQGALAWEVRAAISMARLRWSGGYRNEAVRLLSAVYGRFTEGFETADLRSARQLLSEMS